jgi:hypothetical protein
VACVNADALHQSKAALLSPDNRWECRRPTLAWLRSLLHSYPSGAVRLNLFRPLLNSLRHEHYRNIFKLPAQGVANASPQS